MLYIQEYLKHARQLVFKRVLGNYQQAGCMCATVKLSKASSKPDHTHTEIPAV